MSKCLIDGYCECNNDCEIYRCDALKMYQQGRSDGYSKAENDYHEKHQDILIKQYESGYKIGRADRDKELAEHNVFCSNRPIEDLVFDAIAEERERIVRELEENSDLLVIKGNKFPSCIVSLDKAIKIVKGDNNE